MAIFQKYRSVFLYGVALAGLLLVLRLLEWQLIIIDNSFELYAGTIAIGFTLLGIWLSRKLLKPKTILIEKQVLVRNNEFQLNEKMLSELGLSKRELEILGLMAEGLSNQQIAERLFVSLNTIKTHSSNLFIKLDVQRRTQAIEKARRLSLIA